jgi:signal transduction histidine kinase
MAQASSEFSEADFSQIRIDEILWQAKRDVLKVNDNYQININFSESIDDELKLTGKGNEQLLRTALSNIIDNSCKYSGNHTAEISVTNEGNNVIMNFSDTGIGISEEELKMIFQAFYRAKSATNTKGHGIGLSLVEKIITSHNGKISVMSELSKGSTFTIILPLHS